MGFFDRLDNYMTGPQRRAADLANEANALRVRQAQREEENLLRQKQAMPALMNRLNTSGAMLPEGERTIENSIFSDRNTSTDELLGRVNPQAALERGLAKAYPGERDPLVLKQGDQIRDRSTLEVLASNAGPTEPADLSKQFKQQFGTDVPIGYAPVMIDGKMNGDIRPLRGIKDPGTAPKDTFADEARLRGEFDTKTNEFGIVRNAYSAISEFEKNPSAAGDISLVFQFMKLQDPTSGVKEGEYATAENAAGVPARLRNLFNKVKDGSFLTPQQRADFVGQSGRLYESRLKQYKSEENRYRDLAKRYGLDADKITYDRSNGLTKSDAMMPKVGEVQDGYQFKGGDPALESSWVRVN